MPGYHNSVNTKTKVKDRLRVENPWSKQYTISEKGKQHKETKLHLLFIICKWSKLTTLNIHYVSFEVVVWGSRQSMWYQGKQHSIAKSVWGRSLYNFYFIIFIAWNSYWVLLYCNPVPYLAKLNIFRFVNSSPFRVSLQPCWITWHRKKSLSVWSCWKAI